MVERIFTLKKGVDVPASFDGATVPFQVAGSNEDMLKLAGDNAYVVFNQAYSLMLQKAVKDEAQEEGATIEGLRKFAADYKLGQVRVRGTGSGARKVKPETIDNALGADFLAMLTPEQLALYNQKKAALASRPAATPAAAPAGTNAKAPAPAAKPAKK